MIIEFFKEVKNLQRQVSFLNGYANGLNDQSRVNAPVKETIDKVSLEMEKSVDTLKELFKLETKRLVIKIRALKKALQGQGVDVPDEDGEIIDDEIVEGEGDDEGDGDDEITP